MKNTLNREKDEIDRPRLHSTTILRSSTVHQTPSNPRDGSKSLLVLKWTKINKKGKRDQTTLTRDEKMMLTPIRQSTNPIEALPYHSQWLPTERGMREEEDERGEEYVTPLKMKLIGDIMAKDHSHP
ncbi:hypothetical protein Dimus_039663 [Dionaea muscipula]